MHLSQLKVCYILHLSVVLSLHWWSQKDAYLVGTFKQNPLEKESDLKLVENSTNHPMRRPSAPIATTRIILEDLQSLISVTCLNSRCTLLNAPDKLEPYLVALVIAIRAVRMATTV